MYPSSIWMRNARRSFLSKNFHRFGIESGADRNIIILRYPVLVLSSSTSSLSTLATCSSVPNHSSIRNTNRISTKFNYSPSPILVNEVLNESCRLGLLMQLNQTRLFHTSRTYYNLKETKGATASSPSPPNANSSSDDDKKPSSKVEESVKVIKEELKEKALAPVTKRSIWKRIEDEILHYYHGFRLLFLDIRLSIGLINRVLNGKSLSRREHRQLIRTTSDLFRLVPFSVFIIVPFMELLLPVFLKFFPGMLPSTFQTKNDRENKMKAQLKVKLEMAKFLQQTLDDMSLQSTGHSSEKAKEFAIFFNKIRTSGAEVTNEEIIKFSKLFEDEITLDSLSRQQLVALCHVLEIPALGNNTLLRFQLKMRLRSLMADDKTIELEGINMLSVSELQQACKARGMRAVGVDEDRLKRQLSQWLELSLHEKIPPSLLLLSRAMYLPEDLPASVKLQATISALPESAVTHAKAVIGEREGKVDHKTRIEVIKEEERKIKEERLEEVARAAAKAKEDKEVLIDKAPILSDETKPVEVSEAPEVPKVVVPKEKKIEPSEPLPELEPVVHVTKSRDPITVSETVSRRLSRNVPHPVADLLKEGLSREDMDNIEDALDTLGVEKKRLYIEKEELEDLKEEMADYKEDIQDLAVLTTTAGAKPVDVKETKAAKRLFKKVSQMISNMDSIVDQLHKEENKLISELKGTTEAPEAKKSQLIATEELIDAIQRLQKVSDPARLERIVDVIENLDLDRDGHVEVDDVLKVVELIGRENVKLQPKQVAEIVSILSKEENIAKERKGKAQQDPKLN